VKNFTLEDNIYRVRVNVGVTYNSDVPKVKSVLESCDVKAHLTRIVNRDTGLFVELVQHEVRKRGLGTLDHGGEHRLFPHEAVQQQGSVR